MLSRKSIDLEEIESIKNRCNVETDKVYYAVVRDKDTELDYQEYVTGVNIFEKLEEDLKMKEKIERRQSEQFKIISCILKAWEKKSDQRLLQLIINSTNHISSDLYYMEDDVLIDLLNRPEKIEEETINLDSKMLYRHLEISDNIKNLKNEQNILTEELCKKLTTYKKGDLVKTSTGKICKIYSINLEVYVDQGKNMYSLSYVLETLISNLDNKYLIQISGKKITESDFTLYKK